MFGMGATLSLDDFARVARMPKPIFLGFLAQHTIMPTAWRRTSSRISRKGMCRFPSR
jgi:hypothetical protein